MTPERAIKMTLTKTERNNCRGQNVQRKEQSTLSREELKITILGSFFRWLTTSFVLNDTSILELLANKRAVSLIRLVLVSKG